MAILGWQTAPNFAHGSYHRILRAELNCAPGDPNPRLVVLLGFYADAAAREQAPGLPMYTHSLVIDIAQLEELGLPDPRAMLYGYLLEHHPMFVGTNAVSDVPETAPA
jgi:hypothetical protein